MSTNDDAKRPSAVDLLRPAVRAMPGYTPGEQISDLVKLNTNEGAFPPSPRVMATLAAIADESLRLYPDPVSRAPARGRRRPVRRRAPTRSSRATVRTTVSPSSTAGSSTRASGSPARGRPTASTTRWRRCRAPSWRGSPSGRTARRWELPGDLARQRAKMIILANPNNPSGTLVARRRAAPPVRRRARRRRRRRRGVRRLRARGRHRREHAAVPGQHPNLVVLRTISKSYSLAGARLGLLFAAAPLVAELMKVKDSYNVNAVTQALGVAALEDRSYHEDCVRQTLDQRARLGTRAGGDRLDLARIGGELPAVRDRRARRGGVQRAQGRGPAGALVEGARAAHEDPDQRRQSRRERPPDRRAQAPGVIAATGAAEISARVRQAGHIGKLTIVIP